MYLDDDPYPSIHYTELQLLAVPGFEMTSSSRTASDLRQHISRITSIEVIKFYNPDGRFLPYHFPYCRPDPF